MSSTSRVTNDPKFVACVYYDRIEALFLADLIKTHYEKYPSKANFPLLAASADYLKECASDRRKAERRQK